MAREFGESWLSPGVQKYLGSAFGSPNAARDATQTEGLASEARLQQRLASLVRKQEGPGGPYGASTGAATDRIAAYQPAPVLAQAPTSAPSTTNDLAADYRAQLQRYAQQLAVKEGEVAALRQEAAQLRQQAAGAESRAAHVGESLSRQAAAAGQLEAANAALERQLAEREAEVTAAAQARRAAELAAAAAKAQAAAVHKAAGGRTAEFEAERRYFKEQLERRDEELLRLVQTQWCSHSQPGMLGAERMTASRVPHLLQALSAAAVSASLTITRVLCCRLEEALRKQAAEVERRSREWEAREAELSAAHSRTHGTSAAAQAEMAVAQEALEAASRRVRALEADNAELRRQKVAAGADLRMLEELLADGDAERRCVAGCGWEGK